MLNTRNAPNISTESPDDNTSLNELTKDDIKAIKTIARSYLSDHFSLANRNIAKLSGIKQIFLDQLKDYKNLLNSKKLTSYLDKNYDQTYTICYQIIDRYQPNKKSPLTFEQNLQSQNILSEESQEESHTTAKQPGLGDIKKINEACRSYVSRQIKKNPHISLDDHKLQIITSLKNDRWPAVFSKLTLQFRYDDVQEQLIKCITQYNPSSKRKPSSVQTDNPDKEPMDSSSNTGSKLDVTALKKLTLRYLSKRYQGTPNPKNLEEIKEILLTQIKSHTLSEFTPYFALDYQLTLSICEEATQKYKPFAVRQLEKEAYFKQVPVITKDSLPNNHVSDVAIENLYRTMATQEPLPLTESPLKKQRTSSLQANSVFSHNTPPASNEDPNQRTFYFTYNFGRQTQQKQ